MWILWSTPLQTLPPPTMMQLVTPTYFWFWGFKFLRVCAWLIPLTQCPQSSLLLKMTRFHSFDGCMPFIVDICHIFFIHPLIILAIVHNVALSTETDISSTCWLHFFCYLLSSGIAGLNDGSLSFYFLSSLYTVFHNTLTNLQAPFVLQTQQYLYLSKIILTHMKSSFLVVLNMHDYQWSWLFFINILWEMSIQNICPLINHLFVYLIFELSSLYILYLNFLLDIWFTNISLHSVRSCCILFILWKQKDGVTSN